MCEISIMTLKAGIEDHMHLPYLHLPYLTTSGCTLMSATLSLYKHYAHPTYLLREFFFENLHLIIPQSEYFVWEDKPSHTANLFITQDALFLWVTFNKKRKQLGWNSTTRQLITSVNLLNSKGGHCGPVKRWSSCLMRMGRQYFIS